MKRVAIYAEKNLVKRPEQQEADMAWTLSSPNVLARFQEASELANRQKFADALRAYISIFSLNREEELGWIGEDADSKPAPLKGEMIDSEMIGLVEIYKVDCLRHLGKPEVAFRKLQDPSVTDALSRIQNQSHIVQCFQMRLALADELDDVGMMEISFTSLLDFAMRFGDAETVLGVWNRRSRARLRLGREHELRTLRAEDLVTRADWGDAVPSDQRDRVEVAKESRRSSALTVKALNVEKMLELVTARDQGPLLLAAGEAAFPFEDVEVSHDSLVAVSWKHVGENCIPDVDEPASAASVLRQSLEFARDFGARHLWMDVYCVQPAGVDVDDALEWMGQLYATATVYPAWAGEKGQAAAQTSGWIFQERMWTRMALRLSTLVDAVANLIEYDHSVRVHQSEVPEKNAEDLMDIVRSTLRITGAGLPKEFPLDPWEFLARVLVERNERHPLSDAVVDLQHRGTQFVKDAVLSLAEFVNDGRSRCRTADEIVVFEPPSLSADDIHKVVSAMSSTKLMYESDATAAYFGVFNSRCGTKFAPDALPGPRHLLGRLVDTRRFDSNTTLAGAGIDMHVVKLHGKVDFGPAEQTTFGYPTTEDHWKIGFCRRDDVFILALLDEHNKSVSTGYGVSFRHALALMFVSQADALRLPNALKPRTDADIGAFVERLPIEVVA